MLEIDFFFIYLFISFKKSFFNIIFSFINPVDEGTVLEEGH